MLSTEKVTGWPTVCSWWKCTFPKCWISSLKPPSQISTRSAQIHLEKLRKHDILSFTTDIWSSNECQMVLLPRLTPESELQSFTCKAVLHGMQFHCTMTFHCGSPHALATCILTLGGLHVELNITAKCLQQDGPEPHLQRSMNCQPH